MCSNELCDFCVIRTSVFQLVSWYCDATVNTSTPSPVHTVWHVCAYSLWVITTSEHVSQKKPVGFVQQMDIFQRHLPAYFSRNSRPMWQEEKWRIWDEWSDLIWYTVCSHFNIVYSTIQKHTFITWTCQVKKCTTPGNRYSERHEKLHSSPDWNWFGCLIIAKGILSK